MGKRENDRTEAWELRKMENIKWADKMKNEDVLSKVGVKRALIPEVQTRKGNWLAHVIRDRRILTVSLEGSLEGGQKRGRRRLKLLHEVEKLQK